MRNRSAFRREALISPGPDAAKSCAKLSSSLQMAGAACPDDAITSRGRHDGFGALTLWRTHWTVAASPPPAHTHTHTHTHGHGHGAQEAHSSLPSACQCLLWSSLGAAQPGLRPQGQSVSMHRASAQVYSSQCMRSVHSVCVRNPYLTQALTLLEWSRSTPGQDGMACQLCGHTQRHLSVAAVATTAPTPTPVPGGRPA